MQHHERIQQKGSEVNQKITWRREIRPRATNEKSKTIRNKHLTYEINAMFYVYVLKPLNDRGLYIGCTKDLKARINGDNTGQVGSTKNRLPMELIYYEAVLDQEDAFHREKYLKTAYGRRYLKNRLKRYFTG